jgi:SAM-dependent methyltransferase
MSRQERYRQLYRRLRPDWQDSLTIVRGLVDQNVGPESSVLDVGCGHAEWLSSEMAKTQLAVGVDPDLQALVRSGSLSHRVVAMAEGLPFAPGTFDVVVSAFVFEHLEEPLAAVREMRRVLRPTGRLIFLTPNAWNYNVWLIRLVPNRLHGLFTRRLYGRQDSDTYPVRYRLNTPPQIERTMSTAGFRRVQLLHNGDPTYVGLSRSLFAVARAIERLHDLGRLRQARVHLIGVYDIDGQ